MQVSFNPKQNNQQFGMSMYSNEAVNKALSNRIKNTNVVERLENAFERAKENNLVDVHLLIQPDGKSISANICSRDDIKYHFSQHSENWFTKLTKGPVGFIEDLVVKAEKAAQKVQQKKAIEEKINQL